MCDRKPFEDTTSGIGQDDVLAAVIHRIGPAADEAGRVGAIDQLDNGVMAKLQRVGELTYDGRLIAFAPANREEKLVLCRREPGVAGRLFGKALKHPERVTEAGECLVLAIGKASRSWAHASYYIVSR